jgi:hypothetical protein
MLGKMPIRSGTLGFGLRACNTCMVVGWLWEGESQVRRLFTGSEVMRGEEMLAESYFQSPNL